MKRCCRCKVDLPVAEFYRAAKRPDGLQTICKDCTQQQNRARKEADPGWWRKYDRTMTPEQRERANARVAAWHRENRERKNETARRWYASNLTRARERAVAQTAAYHARKTSAFVEKVDPQEVLLRDSGICGLCGDPLGPDGYEVDHIIPLSRGGEHSYANTQIAHAFCNRSKGARFKSELAAVV